MYIRTDNAALKTAFCRPGPVVSSTDDDLPQRRDARTENGSACVVFEPDQLVAGPGKLDIHDDVADEERRTSVSFDVY